MANQTLKAINGTATVNSAARDSMGLSEFTTPESPRPLLGHKARGRVDSYTVAIIR